MGKIALPRPSGCGLFVCVKRESARLQRELLDGYFGSDVVVAGVGDEQDCDPVESADVCRRGNGKAKCFTRWGRFEGEVVGQAGDDGLRTERELAPGGRGRVGEQQGDVENASVVVAIENVEIDGTAAGKRDGRTESLLGLHDERDEVVGLNVDGERRAAGLVGVEARRMVGGLEVPVGPVEANDERLGCAGGEQRCGFGQRRDDLFFLRRRPEDNTVIAGDAVCGGRGLGLLVGVFSRGDSVRCARCVGCFEVVAMRDPVEQCPDSDQDGGNENQGEAQGGTFVFAVGVGVIISRQRPLPGEDRRAEREQSACRVIRMGSESPSCRIETEGDHISIRLPGSAIERLGE
jgi:hypothetical protein